MKKMLLAVVLMSALLAIGRGAALTSTLLGNLASLFFIREWQAIGAPSALFDCEPYQSGSKAEPLLRAALRLNPQNERVLLNLGRLDWARGDCAAAEDTWKRARFLKPNDPTALLLLASAQLTRGEVEPALEFYRQMGYGGLFRDLGRQFEAAGRRQEAMKWYDMSFSILQDRDSAQMLAAIYMNVTNEPAKAIGLWKQLQNSTADTDPDHWFAAGQAAEIQQDFATALRAYETGLPLARNAYETYLLGTRAALSAERVKDPNKARSYHETALKAQPQLISTYLALGQLELEEGRQEAALEWYERARQIAPESELPDYYEGVAYWEGGAKQQALAAFEQALSRNPENPLPLYYLAIYAYEQNELEQAIAYLEEALSNYDGMAISWLTTLTDWYLKAGRCNEALLTYTRVLEWEPANPVAQAKLAESQRMCR